MKLNKSYLHVYPCSASMPMFVLSDTMYLFCGLFPACQTQKCANSQNIKTSEYVPPQRSLDVNLALHSVRWREGWALYNATNEFI